MDTFKQYLSDTGHSLVSFAACVGISQNYMSEIASRQKKPSYEVACKIHFASGKVVPFEHWLNPSDAVLPRKACGTITDCVGKINTTKRRTA